MERKKGQSAMEYLMTYGWAILVIIIVIAVLFYIGVLNPRNVTPSTCTFPPGISCQSFKLVSVTTQIDLTIGQATGHAISVTGLICTQESGAPATFPSTTWLAGNIGIPQGEYRKIANGSATGGTNNLVKCRDSQGVPLIAPSNAVGEFYKGKLWINYTEQDTSVVRIQQGDIAAKWEV